MDSEGEVVLWFTINLYDILTVRESKFGYGTVTQKNKSYIALTYQDGKIGHYSNSGNNTFVKEF
jgi:hypothetical protein